MKQAETRDFDNTAIPASHSGNIGLGIQRVYHLMQREMGYLRDAWAGTDGPDPTCLRPEAPHKLADGLCSFQLHRKCTQSLKLTLHSSSDLVPLIHATLAPPRFETPNA